MTKKKWRSFLVVLFSASTFIVVAKPLPDLASEVLTVTLSFQAK